MDWVLIYVLVVIILPFPIAFLYALLKRVNKFLTFTPLVIVIIHSLLIYYLFLTGGEGGLQYIFGCFILAIIGGAGLYYGFAKRMYHYGKSELSLNAFRCFLYCLPIIVFPIVSALVWCWAVSKMPKPSEVVKAKPPELGKRPSWGEVVKEREEEEGGD